VDLLAASPFEAWIKHHGIVFAFTLVLALKVRQQNQELDQVMDH